MKGDYLSENLAYNFESLISADSQKTGGCNLTKGT